MDQVLIIQGSPTVSVIIEENVLTALPDTAGAASLLTGPAKFSRQNPNNNE